MAMEREFLEFMPYTVVVHRFLSMDFTGNKVYDTAHPKSYRARIVGKGLSLRRHQGEEDTVVFDIYMDTGNDVIHMEDQIILPDDEVWIDQTPEIFSVGRFPDDVGHHHTKIQCGWMYHRQGQ